MPFEQKTVLTGAQNLGGQFRRISPRFFAQYLEIKERHNTLLKVIDALQLAIRKREERIEKLLSPRYSDFTRQEIEDAVKILKEEIEDCKSYIEKSDEIITRDNNDLSI